jgi:hypothetical protein
MCAALQSLLWLACVSTVISDPASIVNSVVAAGQSRLVIVVTCNMAHRPFLLNFLESLRKLGLDTKLLVVAVDQTMQEEAEKIGLPTLAGNELVSISQYSSLEQKQEMQLHEAPWLAYITYQIFKIHIFCTSRTATMLYPFMLEYKQVDVHVTEDST